MLALPQFERHLRKVDLIDEGFLHKKINNNDVYWDYGAIELRRDPRRCMQFKEAWRFDHIELK